MKRVTREELRHLSVDERVERLSNALSAVYEPINGELVEVARKIDAYERRFGFSSAEMRAKLDAGELAETSEVCDWLMLLDLRSCIGTGGGQKPT